MTRPPRWTPPEIDYVNELAGDVPFADLVRRFQQRAKQQGWPPRTECAILKRLHRTHQRGGCRHGEWLTIGYVGEVLGCPGARVDGWLRRRGVAEILQPRWRGKVRYVERVAWRRLARQMPRILGGFPVDRLFLLLEDQELANEVARAYPRTIGDWRLRCVETRKVYRNCAEVAERHHVSHSAVSLAVRRGRMVTSIGRTFVRIGNLSEMR
jgi:hypothetical protein